VQSCPEECAPHADALALGDGVQLWPQILRDVETGVYDPAMARTTILNIPRIRRRAGGFFRVTVF